MGGEQGGGEPGGQGEEEEGGREEKEVGLPFAHPCMKQPESDRKL